jgi:exodeoxyribonuclease VII large subunit
LNNHEEHTDHLTLHQLSLHIKDAIEGNFMQQIWVVAEIASLNMNQSSGHCYLELVEKTEKSVVAKMRANIWSFKLQNILNKFFQVTGSALQAGMKTLLLAEVQYHPLYGISLNVIGIDPSYSLGDLARRKKEVEERLVKEGLIDKNKALEFPLVPQRIALISSETAAGYEDFMNQLQNNVYGYHIDVKTFQALMQGDKTASSIISALQKIEAKAAQFDIIVIVRGGGSTVELSAFDDYELAKAIANCSLPVVTGIGHERDESIADMVAHQKLKTPTAVAEYILMSFQSFDEMLIDAKSRLKELLADRLLKENTFINEASHVITRKSLVFVQDKKAELLSLNRDVKEFANRFLEKKKRILNEAKMEVNSESKRLLREKQFEAKDNLKSLAGALSKYVQQKKFDIKVLEQKVNLLDPAKVLARGYTMSYVNGKVVKSAQELKSQEELTTVFKDGSVKSKII